MAPRLALATAFFLPTLVVVVRDPIPERAIYMLAWSILGSLTVANVPGRWFSLVLCAAWISAPVVIWWSGYASLNGLGPGLEAASAALDTSRGEALEAARMLLHYKGFVGVVAGHLVLLLIASVLWVRDAKIVGAVATDKAVKRMLLVAILPFAAIGCWETFDRNAPAIIAHVDAMAFPLGTYVGLAHSVVDRAVYGGNYDGGTRTRVTAVAKVTEPVLSIFVIGESVRSGGIGPAKATPGSWTKMLDDRFKAGLGTWLPDTCASAHGTRMSVPMLITGTDPDHIKDSLTAPSGLAQLKAAGFVTAWITNQDLSVFKEDGHDFTWVGPVDYLYRYDEVLVPVAEAFAGPLLSSDATSERPRAIVVHLLGSHFEYDERYPAMLFPPEPAGLVRDELSELRYDRANEYGARTLVLIAKLVDNAKVPAFAVFTSDHGENLPSDHNGLLTHLGSRTSQRDGTTASLIIWNKAMADTGAPRVRLAKLTSVPMIAHKDLYNAWMALSGVGNPVVEPTRDPKIWANVDIGSAYRSVSCSLLKP